MKTSNTVEAIFQAQIEMQSNLTDVGKDKEGYGYKYASFDSIVQHLRPLLSAQGLGFIQTSTSNGDYIGVTTRLIHKSGEWVEDTFTMPLVTLAKMNNYQVAGSAITYLKRYGLSAIVGIAVDEDIDASGEQSKPEPKQQQKAPPPSKADDDVKKQLWNSFKARCGTIDPMLILERDGIDMGDKNKVYATVRQYMALNEDMFQGVLDNF